MQLNDEMKQYILTSPSAVDLKKKAVKNGMIPMKEDGLLKVKEGITTLEELERVIQ
jgi:type II secretory ATPase GspE/PulE/Tfp pilus assembly ATPase PilB-like protein